MASRLSCKILLSIDVLELIVVHLTRREAIKLSAVCRELREILSANKFTYTARLVVVASESNLLLDLCPKSGNILHCATILQRALRKNEKLSNFWPTGVAMSPYDGDYYVCQYKGPRVLQFRGTDLSFRGLYEAVSAFSTNYVYRHPNNDAVQHLYRHVPWGMSTGPDGNLYIAMEEGYRALKGVPLNQMTGNVMRAQLNDEGQVVGFARFCGAREKADERLCRPSGISFDAKGDLYVTSLTNEVLMYKGPLRDHPGEFIKIAASWGGFANSKARAGALLPWDVKWHPGITGIGEGPLLLVTRHTDVRRKSKSRVSIVCARTGADVHSVFSKQLKMGNMMEVE
ncbi:g8965 [Coccomyxa elongata]